MPRLLSSLAILGLVTPAVIGLPVATAPGAAPHAVAPTVTQVPIGATVPAPGTTAGPALRRLSNTAAQPVSKPFTTLGVTWRADSRLQEPVVTARWLRGSAWSAWTVVPSGDDDAPDPGSVDTAGARPGTRPLWVGWSTGVEVRVETAGGVRPQDLRLELVDPGRSAADAAPAPRDTARAEPVPPTVLSRATWGADESLRRSNPSYSSTVKAGFVHHTVNANSYSEADVPALLRGIYAYHVKSNGWSDIGYNFLIDRFGRTWEGRAGGIDRAVIGAHTGGFNSDTFGASLLGTYSSVTPSAATLEAVRTLFAWKLGKAYRDPLGKVSLRSAGGGTAKYASGTYHSFDVISGHRDAGSTSCPGDLAYAQLDEIRRSVAARIGPGFLAPKVTPSSTYVGSPTPISLTAGIIRPATWTVEIRNSSGLVLRSFVGLAATSVDVTWDLKDAVGLPVPPGVYTLRLTDVDGEGRSGLPYVTTVQYRVPAISKGSWMRPKGFFPRTDPAG